MTSITEGYCAANGGAAVQFFRLGATLRAQRAVFGLGRQSRLRRYCAGTYAGRRAGMPGSRSLRHAAIEHLVAQWRQRADDVLFVMPDGDFQLESEE